VDWREYEVLTSATEVAAGSWDQVYLAMSSIGLRGPWLAELAAATGEASFVLLQPGLDDRAVAVAGVGEARLVQGMISLISYPAPLPGETRFPRPGMAYWFPPLSPSPMSGPTERRDAVVAALRAGGLPSRARRDVAPSASFASSLMMPVLVALEQAGWSLARLFSAAERGRLDTALAASREAMAVVGRRFGRQPPALLRLAARPLSLRTGVAIGRRLIPLDLEAYLARHFTKVGDQTRALLSGYIDHGREDGLPVAALERLRAEAGR
jgi:2-dehydropantoate 2-reductase